MTSTAPHYDESGTTNGLFFSNFLPEIRNKVGYTPSWRSTSGPINAHSIFVVRRRNPLHRCDSVCKRRRSQTAARRSQSSGRILPVGCHSSSDGCALAAEFASSQYPFPLSLSLSLYDNPVNDEAGAALRQRRQSVWRSRR